MYLSISLAQLSTSSLDRTYKTWFYGLYINTARNIIIDSCTIADSAVGILPYVMGPAGKSSYSRDRHTKQDLHSLSGLSHVAEDSTTIIRNSMIIGAITPNDCSDIRDTTTVSAKNGLTAIPTVAAKASDGEPSARTGISFPYFSGDNMIPRHPYTSVGNYPCSK